MRQIVATVAEKQDLTSALKAKIPTWAQECGGKLSAILRGSDATFKKAEVRLLNQFESHLKASTTALYSPEKITRRNEMIGNQLSRNLADPAGQKYFQGSMHFALQHIGKQTQICPLMWWKQQRAMSGMEWRSIMPGGDGNNIKVVRLWPRGTLRCC
jgi:hypothetical protein